MPKRKTKRCNREAVLERLRLFTSVAGLVTRRPMTPEHQDAIAQYAARQLPARTLTRLRSKAGGIAALEFIVRSLQSPQLSR